MPRPRQLGKSISVFFPAYNDACTIGTLVTNALEVLSRISNDYEVIVINDGSQDHTAQVLEELRLQYEPRVRIVTHEVNRGYGGALRSGFAAATKDWIFYTDGDGQYDVLELPLLAKHMADDVSLINGYKRDRQDPWHRIWIGAAYNAFSKGLFQVQLRDIDCDFRLMPRRLVQSLDLFSTSGTICVELVRKLERTGMRVVEVEVSHYPRVHGRSQFFRVKSLAKTFGQLLRLYGHLVLSIPAKKTAGKQQSVAEERVT
jgi:glycosyltransferase involved in cell wall biosynthesis